ncbi:unnamed protein product, partial [marine sediment metagenome]
INPNNQVDFCCQGKLLLKRSYYRGNRQVLGYPYVSYSDYQKSQ